MNREQTNREENVVGAHDATPSHPDGVGGLRRPFSVDPTLLGEHAEHPATCGRTAVRFGGGEPRDFGDLPPCGQLTAVMCRVRRHVHPTPVGVAVGELVENREKAETAGIEFHAEFLTDLPAQTFDVTFPGLSFTTRKVELLLSSRPHGQQPAVSNEDPRETVDHTTHVIDASRQPAG